MRFRVAGYSGGMNGLQVAEDEKESKWKRETSMHGKWTRVELGGSHISEMGERAKIANRRIRSQG